jgi:hypothetical protein
VDGVPAHFVFNMDEMGHQDWADRAEKTCVVPVSHAGDYVYVPVSRAGKRITLIACIARDGSTLRPEVIIPRKTVDIDMVLTGLTSEKVTIRSQRHGFIDTRIFDSWFEETFIPELLRRRAVHGYQGPAVLLIDNCSAHNGPRFHELCGVHRVVPCYFPPHSSNQLQPLDLSLFGVTKRLLSRVNKLDAVNIQTRHVASVVCAFLAAVPWNVVKTFKISGICLVADDDVLRCSVRPEMAERLNQPLPLALQDWRMMSPMSRMPRSCRCSWRSAPTCFTISAGRARSKHESVYSLLLSW